MYCIRKSGRARGRNTKNSHGAKKKNPEKRLKTSYANERRGKGFVFDIDSDSGVQRFQREQEYDCMDYFHLDMLNEAIEHENLNLVYLILHNKKSRGDRSFHMWDMYHLDDSLLLAYHHGCLGAFNLILSHVSDTCAEKILTRLAFSGDCDRLFLESLVDKLGVVRKDLLYQLCWYVRDNVLGDLEVYRESLLFLRDNGAELAYLFRHVNSVENARFLCIMGARLDLKVFFRERVSFSSFIEEGETRIHPRFEYSTFEHGIHETELGPLREIVRATNTITKIQPHIRRNMAKRRVDILRCTPEFLFNSEFGSRRRRLLGVEDDLWDCGNFRLS